MANHAENIARYQKKCRETEWEKALALQTFFKRKGLTYAKAIPLINEIRKAEGLAPVALGTLANWCSARAKIPEYIIKYISEH